LKRRGFVEISAREKRDAFVAHGLIPPQNSVPGEVGFKCSRHGYTMKVWTSCLRALVRECSNDPENLFDVIVSIPTDEDCGWVLIVDEYNRAEYYARHVNRTKNFVENLLERAWITFLRMANRPLCPKCEKYMHIHRKENMQTFWICKRASSHDTQKPFFKNWDFALTDKAQRAANKPRKSAANFRKAQRALGKEPRTIVQVRKKTGWKATKDPY
jgi:hypothetical protein